MSLDYEGIKAQESFAGAAPWRYQLELFLCYCTRNKGLYGTRHLSLPRETWGRTGEERWSVCESGAYRESSRALLGSLEMLQRVFSPSS